MKHQRITTVIIGEGPTEFYYLNSLKDDYRILQSIKPDTPKNTSLRELAQSIEDSIKMGYNRIYCLIDMDTKYKDAKSRSDYQSLKKKYHGTRIYKPKAGVDCTIKFFETDRCTELFFLYYFRYTTQEFSTSESVESLLNKVCGYEKSIKFFRGHPLHQFFTKQGGSFLEAIANANKSINSKTDSRRAYSEIGKMFEELGITKV